MDVETLCKTYQRKMWISMISRKKLSIDIWHVMTHAKEKVFYMPYNGKFKFQINTEFCLKCKRKIEVGFMKNHFVAKTCICSNDNKNYATLEKLTSIFEKEQADNILAIYTDNKTRNLPNKLSFWNKQGFSEQEARLKIREHQIKASKNSPSTVKGERSYSPRCKEYWIKLGLTTEQADEKISDIQVGNGLKWYKKRYGEYDGLVKFNARMKKWQESYNLALENDPTILERKTVNLGQASKQSLKIFSPIYEKYHKKIAIYLGIPESQEYFLRDDKTLYFYDFTIPELKIIVEFNGSSFHPNKNILTEAELNEWKSLFSGYNAEVIMARDLAKQKFAEAKGYTVLVIWDTDNVDETINKIEKLIENKL